MNWCRILTVKPVIEQALVASTLEAELSLAGKDSDQLIIAYPTNKTGTGYAAATIRLEFGARATGEPHRKHHVACDTAPLIESVEFPSASSRAQINVFRRERCRWH